MFLSILMHSGWWLLNKKPKIILASWAFPEAVAASWLSKLFNCRFFFKVHGSDINLHGRIPARAKQIVKASKHASGILSVSQALAEQMITMGIDKNKIEVIYNGVDHQLFGQKTANPLLKDYVLYVGNLKKEKGVIELLEGFAAIHSDHPNLHLVFAGPGNLKTMIESMAKELGIAQSVNLLGGVNHDQLPALIANAKLLALPSYNEGVPNVVLEAMACGTPILATSVGGIPEVVDEEVCGKLVPEKSVQGVTEGLEYILKHQWSRHDIKQHSAKFSWQNNKKQLNNLLTQKQ
jgi:glycosyltransferase involved in cell wall biosynthesis